MSVTVDNISKTYGQQKALDDVSFSIAKGEVVGFLGPNGAGKSTMMKIATGYVMPDSGKVNVCGIEVNGNSLATHRLIGYLPEHNPLYLDMYVREYLQMVAGMYGLDNTAKRAADVIDMVGLGNESHKVIGALSKGYRQRVGIAQALISNPEVVILDEPTTGLDPNQIVEIRQLIKNVGKEKTVMLSTHIMQEVEAVCDKVIIIDHGKIKAQGSIDEIAMKANGGLMIDFEFDKEIDIQMLASELPSQALSAIGSGKFRMSCEKDIRKEIFDFAVRHELRLIELHAEQIGMETLFHELTEN